MQPVQFDLPSSGSASRHARVNLLPVVAGLVVVFALVGAVRGWTRGAPANNATPSTQTNEVERSVQTPAPKADKPVERPQWRELCSLSGEGLERSEVFKIRSKRVRLAYSIDGGISGVTVFLLRDGTSSDSVAPKVQVDGPISESEVLKVKPGRYRLEVVGANGVWHVGVAEKR